MTDDPLVAAFDVTDEWADYDTQQRLLHAAAAGDTAGPLRFAGYWRVSTEDNQDPETSKNWQKRLAQQLLDVAAPGATIVKEYFDKGESRSLPWSRRPEASQLLDDLADPNRGWDAIVVGEGKRCFFGDQFATVAPTFAYHGVALYVPDLSGRYDPRNSIHGMQMAISGKMSEGERQTVQARVRAGMASQVEVQGRFQGGRAPYGYKAEGYAPHPNPRKAIEGYQLKRLVRNPDTDWVVARIFAEALERKSLREIVTGLNEDGILCPSAYDPSRNAHRSQDGWQVGTVRAILDNVRYTGYEQWGKFKKEEKLVSPTEPALGSKTRLVKNPDAPIRSAKRAHDPIVDVPTFKAVQTEMGRRSTGKAKENPNASVRATVRQTPDYPLRGLVYCASCRRKMSPDWYAKKRDITDNDGKPLHVRYRCRRKDLVEGSERWVGHPDDVTVQQPLLLDHVQDWLADLFAPEHRDTTVQALVGALDVGPTSIVAKRREQDTQRLNEARGRLEHQMRALDSGIDPALLKPRINAAQEEIAVLEATIASYPQEVTPSREDVGALVEQVADHLDVVFGSTANFADLHALLTNLGLHIVYDSQTNTAMASLNLTGEAENPHNGEDVGVNGGVRGGTCPLTPITTEWAF